MFNMNSTVKITDLLRAHGTINIPQTVSIVGMEELQYNFKKATASNRILLITGGTGVGKTSLIDTIKDKKVVNLSPSIFGDNGQIKSDIEKEEMGDTIFVIDMDLLQKNSVVDMVIPHIIRATNATIVLTKTTKQLVAPSLSNGIAGIFDPSDTPISLNNAMRLHINEAGESKTLRILDSHNNSKFAIDGHMMRTIIKLGMQYFPNLNNPHRSLNVLNAIFDAKETHVFHTHDELNNAKGEMEKTLHLSRIFGRTPDKKVETKVESIESIYKKEVEVISPIFSTDNNNETYEKYSTGVFDSRIKEALNKTKSTELTAKNKLVRIDVTIDDVAEVFSSLTSINKDRLVDEITATLEKINDNKSQSERLRDLESNMKKVVIGQDHAVEAMVESIAINSAGITATNKPIGSFMFLGTTGVGKTHIAKSLAKNLYGDENAMVRFDMSEFQQEHAGEKLIGAPPGYVGHDAGGLLTNLVSKNKNAIILLDEIEKAHPKIFDLFLQVLDDGRLTDSKGMVVDFSHTIIIMTSNIGASHISQGNFIQAELELKQRFRPEFLNRIDNRLMFNPLSKANVRKIVINNLKKLAGVIQRKKGVEVKYTEDVVDFIVEVGYDADNGARPIARAISKYIESSIAKKFNESIEFETLFISIGEDNNIVINDKKEELY